MHFFALTQILFTNVFTVKPMSCLCFRDLPDLPFPAAVTKALAVTLKGNYGTYSHLLRQFQKDYLAIGTLDLAKCVEQDDVNCLGLADKVLKILEKYDYKLGRSELIAHFIDVAEIELGQLIDRFKFGTDPDAQPNLLGATDYRNKFHKQSNILKNHFVRQHVDFLLNGVESKLTDDYATVLYVHKRLVDI